MKRIASMSQSEQPVSASGCPVGESGFELVRQGQQTSTSQDHQDLWAEAQTYLALFEEERGTPSIDIKRLAEIQTEVETNGTYWQTYEELAYGAKVAWRNNTRCIGRLQWKSLEVRDMRYLSTAGEVFDAIVEHIRLTTNGGRIRPMITVFAPQAPRWPGIRIWNPQLIRYAGYGLIHTSLT